MATTHWLVDTEAAVLKTSRAWSWPIVALLLLLGTDAGCSRRQKSAEEVNWGQPKPNVARRTPPSERPAEIASGGRAGSTADQAAEGGGNPGPESNGAAGGSGEDGEPSDDPPKASGVGNTPGVGGKGPGGASDTPQDAAPERPAPALPGRAPTKPALTAAEAAEAAKQLLKRAQQHLRTDDASAAAEAAIEAYDKVLPHAESDVECRKLCRQLDEVLMSAGQRPGRPAAVPTRFE